MRQAGVSEELLTLASNKPYVSSNASSYKRMRLNLERRIILEFEFSILEYQGKYGLSKKAQMLCLISMKPCEPAELTRKTFCETHGLNSSLIDVGT